MASKEETSERLQAILAEEEEIVDVDAEAIEEEHEELEEEVEAEEEVAEAEGRSSSREYVVLSQDEKNKYWTEVGRYIATTTENAMSSYENLEDKKVYVAVPSRNWNPKPANVEVKTTISFG